MHMQITGLEPALLKEEKKDTPEKYINVHLVTSLTIEEFIEMQKRATVWGIEIEIKKNKKRRKK